MRVLSAFTLALVASLVAACGSSPSEEPSDSGSSESSSGSPSNGGSSSGAAPDSDAASSSGFGSSSGPASGASSGSGAGSGSGSVAGSGSGTGTGTDSGAGSVSDAGRDAANLPPVTVWIAGDSTVQNYAPGNTSGYMGTSLEGWGQELGQYFDSKVTISNQAIGGRSVAYFMWTVATDSSGNYTCVDTMGTPKFKLDSQGNKIDTTQWARIKSGIKSGDFLLVQFGHNDQTNTCPRYVSTTDFETDLGLMADAVSAKGATPIFVTPMDHRAFTGTTVNNTLLPYANAMKDEASMKGIEVLDLNLRSVEYFQSVGNTYLATNIFDGGTTHFIKAGAVKMAELIAGEVRKNNGRLADYLK